MTAPLTIGLTRAEQAVLGVFERNPLGSHTVDELADALGYATFGPAYTAVLGLQNRGLVHATGTRDELRLFGLTHDGYQFVEQRTATRAAPRREA